MRWLGLALLVFGTALAWIGGLVAWVVPVEKADEIIWSPPGTRFVAAWCWILLGVLCLGIAFAMLVGARRSFLPRYVSLVAAIAAFGGAVFTFAARMAAPAAVKAGMGVRTEIDEYLWKHHIDVELHLTKAPWLELSGFVFAMAGGIVLFVIALNVARQNAAELARINHAQQLVDGDLAPPVEETPIEEPPVPKL